MALGRQLLFAIGAREKEGNKPRSDCYLRHCDLFSFHDLQLLLFIPLPPSFSDAIEPPNSYGRLFLSSQIEIDPTAVCGPHNYSAPSLWQSKPKPKPKFNPSPRCSRSPANWKLMLLLSYPVRASRILNYLPYESYHCHTLYYTSTALIHS